MAHLAVISHAALEDVLRADPDQVRLAPVSRPGPLPYDHPAIVAAAKKELRRRYADRPNPSASWDHGSRSTSCGTFTKPSPDGTAPNELAEGHFPESHGTPPARNRNHVLRVGRPPLAVVPPRQI